MKYNGPFTSKHYNSITTMSLIDRIISLSPIFQQNSAHVYRKMIKSLSIPYTTEVLRTIAFYKVAYIRKFKIVFTT